MNYRKRQTSSRDTHGRLPSIWIVTSPKTRAAGRSHHAIGGTHRVDVFELSLMNDVAGLLGARSLVGCGRRSREKVNLLLCNLYCSMTMPMQYALSLSLSRMPNDCWWFGMRDMPVMYNLKRSCMIEKNGVSTCIDRFAATDHEQIPTIVNTSSSNLY